MARLALLAVASLAAVAVAAANPLDDFRDTVAGWMAPLQSVMGLRGQPADVTVPQCEEGVECKPCCAGFKDGSYASNLTVLAHCGDARALTVGSLFADAQKERHIMWLGSYCPEMSKFGVYLFRDKAEGEQEQGEDEAAPIKATMWGPKTCKTVTVPAKCMKRVPSMCFGRPRSPFSRVLSEWDFDGFTRIRAYGSEQHHAAALVSRRTCFPFAFGMENEHKKRDSSEDGPLGWLGAVDTATRSLSHGRHHDHDRDNGGDADLTSTAVGHLVGVGVEEAKARRSFLGILFQNATAGYPDPHVFTPPRRCRKE